MKQQKFKNIQLKNYMLIQFTYYILHSFVLNLKDNQYLNIKMPNVIYNIMFFLYKTASFDLE